mgnify:CR=1 FL=1
MNSVGTLRSLNLGKIIVWMKNNRWLLGALLVAAALKIVLVLWNVLPFNSDEAIVALMARHILQGNVPTFFYGQAYMGSLDALLVAIGFWVFGEQVWVIRLVQGLLYLGVLVTTAELGKSLLGSKRIGWLAVWLLAIPAVILTLYTTVSLGGYGEALLLGNLMLLQGMKLLNSFTSDRKIPFMDWLILGLLAGFGLWVFGLTLVYSIPVGLVVLWVLSKGKASFLTFLQSSSGLLIGGLVGAAPWIVYAVTHDFSAVLAELGGSAIADASHSHWFVQLWDHLWTFILFGATGLFGLRPSWEIRWLALPLLPFVLIFWMAVMAHIGGRLRREQNQRLGAGLLIAVGITLSLGFIFTPFGGDPSGRYFLPFYIILALFAAEMILRLQEQHGRWVWSLVGLLLIFNLWGTLQSAAQNPPGITTQFDQVAQVDQAYLDELIDFLQLHGETRGYSNYWISYPLAFQTAEEIIFVPALPYHEDFRYTARDNRYSPYNEMLTTAEHTAYITSNHPALDDWLRERFAALNIDYSEYQIGDYHIFYALSRPVHPVEFGLSGDILGLECLKYGTEKSD